MALTDSLMDAWRLGQALEDQIDTWMTQGFGRTVNPVPFDLAETADALVVRAYLPGFQREQVQVEVRDHRLAIKAERRLPETDELTWLHVESPYGTFLRTLNLGNDIETDHIEAMWQDGVLTIRLPKAAEARPRSIPIQVSERPALGEQSRPSADPQ
jgi:HSP20 family protein